MNVRLNNIVRLTYAKVPRGIYLLMHIDGQDLSMLVTSSTLLLPLLAPPLHLRTLHLHPKLNGQQTQTSVNIML